MGVMSRDVQMSEAMQSLRRSFKALQDRSQEVSSSFGMTGPQPWAPKMLRQPASLDLTDLSRKMYLYPSTVTGVIDRVDRKREDRPALRLTLPVEYGMPFICF